MPRNNPVKNKMARDIAKDIGADPKEVLNIIESQFEHLKYSMEKGELSTVRLPYLGKFYVKPARISQLVNGLIQRGEFSGSSRSTDTADS
jgi:nucleoid DNA-binding protein